MNMKFFLVLAALTTVFIACGDDKGSNNPDEGTSSSVVLSSGQLPPSSTPPLSSGQLPPSSAKPLSSGVQPVSSSFVLSSPAASSSAAAPVGKLRINTDRGYKQITGTMNIAPAFVGIPTVSGKVYVNNKEVASTSASITFGTTWSNYITSTGASPTAVPMDGIPSLDARLMMEDWDVCGGLYLAVITITDGATTVRDTASYDLEPKWANGSACPK